MSWALVPAAGSGRRFGGEVPKQYLHAAGQPLIAHALDALLAHPRIDGAVVALAADDPHWPGWTSLHGKPVIACVGGGERADSVLAALRALPEGVAEDELRAGARRRAAQPARRRHRQADRRRDRLRRWRHPRRAGARHAQARRRDPAASRRPSRATACGAR